MERHFVPSGELQKLFKRSLAQLSGAPQRNLVFPAEFKRQESRSLARGIRYIQPGSANQIRREPDFHGFHSFRIPDITLPPIRAAATQNGHR
jgi:hypothetical protein